MLKELRENVSKLDTKAYAELKSYNEPPHVVHQIIRSVLGIFYPQKVEDGEFDNWTNCKQVSGIFGKAYFMPWLLAYHMI